jgi:hypothetical protein
MGAEATQEVVEENIDINEDGNKAEAVEVVTSDVGEEINDTNGEDVVGEDPEDPRKAIYEKFDQEQRDKEQTVDEDGIVDKEIIEEEYLTVKVNGKERQVEKQKVEDAGGVESYQKRLAADEGLRELSENRKLFDSRVTDLQNYERQLLEREQQLSHRDVEQIQADLPNVGDQAQDLSAKAKAYREALLDGEEETADKLLSELLHEAQPKVATPVIDKGEIVNEAKNLALREIQQENYQSNLKDAYSQFSEDYPEIIEDPRLYQITDAETKVIQRENPDWDITKVMTEAGNRVREWRGITPSNKNRIEEKRQLSTPRASSGRQKPKATPKQESNSEYITKLRKARGLE